MVDNVLMNIKKERNTRKVLNFKPTELTHGPWPIKETQ